ncbi:MAG: carotenoid oxygenase family protein [Dehalococcoidia bacterium]
MNAPSLDVSLQGAFAPVDMETAATDLPVIGKLPEDLNGLYVRNGPNPRFTPIGRYHWFDGDGMLSAIRFDQGRASFKSRWVQTDGLGEELAAGRPLWRGLKEKQRLDRPDQPLKNTSNTDVKFHAGQLLSSWYRGGDVYRCDPYSLATLGKLQPDSRLKGLPISSHSRVDERTNEYIFFAYGNEAPYMHYGVIGADGALKNFTPIPLPGPRLPHDMAITEHYSILHDFPLMNDPKALAEGRYRLNFHRDMPSRFAVIPRHGSASDVRWFEATPRYMLHVVNAWEEGDELVMRGTPYSIQRRFDGSHDFEAYERGIAMNATDFEFYEWRFNLRTGATSEQIVDDVYNAEFPTINARLQGLPSRYSYHILMGRMRRPEDQRFAGLVKFDGKTGSGVAYNPGGDAWFSEAPFAPRDGASGEDDGYIVSFVWNARESRSETWVLDARDISRGPVCRVVLPQRVPNGFHATWVSEARLSGSSAALGQA